jgi:hypothetical protein
MNAHQRKIQRWKEILISIDKFGYLTINQIEKINNLKSYRNAYRIIYEMGELLNSHRGYKNIFYLSAEGRKMIGSDKVRRYSKNIEHCLMVADAYIHFNKPALWMNENKFYIQKLDHTIIPDSFFKVDGRFCFLEADRCTDMKQNKEKIKQYKAFKDIGSFQEKNGHFPKLIFITLTEYRAKTLRALLNGMVAEVYLHKDIL